MIADSLPSTVFRAHAALSMSSLLRLPDFSAGLRSVSPSSANEAVEDGIRDRGITEHR